MYIHMNTMAKTIMISNEIYKELKEIKGKNSFSEVLKSLIKKDNKKGENLRDCLGLIKRDDEWEKIEKDLKKGWRNWGKKYV